MDVTVALILVSIAAALRAKPPNPHIPKTPILFGSTALWLFKKSSAAEKSSVLISVLATYLGVPELFPV